MSSSQFHLDSAGAPACTDRQGCVGRADVIVLMRGRETYIGGVWPVLSPIRFPAAGIGSLSLLVCSAHRCFLTGPDGHTFELPGRMTDEMENQLPFTGGGSHLIFDVLSLDRLLAKATR